ncbi:MAG: C25 family cysteine peptidase [Candidatus Acidiferrales bacterium]
MKRTEKLLRRDSSQFAALCAAALQRGLRVRFLAQGQSMQPNILDGDIVLAAPTAAGELRRGDIALTRGSQGLLLHRVVALDPATNRIVTRGDTGQQDDAPAESVLGRAICIERDGKRISLQAPGTKWLHAIRRHCRRVVQAGTRRSSRLRSLLAPLLCALFALCLYASPAAAQFTITNSVAPANVAPGGTVVYTQVLTATGTYLPSAAAPVTTTQTVPTGLSFASYTVTGIASTHWSCALAGTTLTCTDPSNATTYHNNNTTTFMITMTVGAGTASGTLTDSVTSNPGGSNANASLVVSTPDLGVAETAAPNPVATGANITYTETVTNYSTTTAAVGATLTQNTAPNTLFQSVTVPGGWTCGTQPAVGGTGAINCSATGTMAANTAVIFTVVVAVRPEAVGGSTITNLVMVNQTGADPNPSNNSYTISVQVSGADLAMTQVVSAPAVAPGTTITYTETVTNNGPNAAVGAVLYQETPPNTTFSSVTAATGWTCGTAPGVGGTGQVICTDGSNLNSGTTTSNFTFVVTVNGGTAAGTTVTNFADVTSQTTDPVATNNSTSTLVLVEVTGDSDLAVSTTASPTPVFISSAITYTIQVTNLGLATAAGVTLKDTLPATLTNASAMTSAGSCGAPAGGVITCALGTVAYPLAAPITITVTGTSPSSATTMTNVATVSTTGTDPVAGNNSVTLLTVVQPLVCATPGKDGAGGAITGVVNAYYPPAATGTVKAGSTSVALGAAAATGAQTAIASGDLLLIIQMQDAQINSTNTSSYGSGLPGTPSGSTSLGTSGEFEFVTATSGVPVTGGTLSFTGTGVGGGLLNTYSYVAASNTSVPPQGVQTFQVIRVPQYTSATLSSGLTALAWNGATGGVLALDVSSQLTLGGTVATDGLGFRGGGGVDVIGSPTGANTDTLTASPATLPALPPPANSGTNGSKGEGIAGTPHWIAPALSSITHATTARSTAQTYLEGLPNGSYARGAPGNAGGGATDANPTANNQNDGGGGGANGGAGGTGGFAWNSAGIAGGYGGSPFPVTTSALILGGGGGAGTTNDGAYWDPATDTGNADCGADCTGIYSSGAAGGGIVIVRAGSVTGTGTITANGQASLNQENDGTGGGGAGGTILLFANSGGLGGLTAQAAGGNGGNTWPAEAPGTPFPGNRHGPGGGGGGGVILTTSAPGSTNIAGGTPGTSTLANDPYGATAGQTGVITSGLTITQTPGTQSGAYCAGADLAVTDSATPNVVVPGGTITYTQTVTNNGPMDAVNATFVEAVPGNTTFESLAVAPGWSCTMPAPGNTGNISCTNPDVADAATGTFTLAVLVLPGTVSGTQILNTDSVSSGTNDPNLANNSASVLTIVGAAGSANLVVSNSASPNPVLAGNRITYTITVTNNGPSATSSVTFTDAIPANTTLYSFAQTGTVWSCPTPGAAVTCTIASLPAGATTTFTLIVTVGAGTASGTVITDTASTSTSTPDPNPSGNTSTALVTVATAGQFDLSVTSSATPNPVTPGNNITFLLNFANSGPSSASSVTYTDAVAANTTFVSLALPAGTTCPTLPAVGGTGAISCCPGSAGVCSGAAYPSGSSTQLPLVVKVAAGTASGTVISNTASIAPTTNDVNPGNNTSVATTVVASPTQADVAIVKSAAPEPVDQGATLTYTLQVTNNGPAVAQNVQVSDPLPGQVNFVSVSTTQGTCTQAAGTVSCSLGSLGVGGLVTITISTTAETFSSSSLVPNTATVGSSTSDPNPANNFSSTLSTIQSSTAVQLSSFRAQMRSGGGVVLEWHTREEVRNLGFHVYREDAQGRHQLDPSLIAGGALFLRGGRPQHSARTYQWIDPQGGPGSSYTLEDVDLSGVRTTHGPVTPDSTIPDAAPVSQATLLTQLTKSLAAAPASALTMRPRVALPVAQLRATDVTNAYLDGLPAAKISVSAEGWYVITRAQLAAAGFDPGSDASMLRLFAEGVEQPMAVLGESGGAMAANGAIAFYGTGIDTPFSGTRVYWLIQGSQPGKRIPISVSELSGPSAVHSFSSTVTLEQRTTYFAALLNGPNADNFFGALISTDPVDQDLTIEHYDETSSIPTELDVTLQGVTTGQAHSVSVALNGASVGTLNFNDQANYTSSFSVEQSLIHDGTNVVTLTALNGENDTSLVQSIVLHFAHTYTADSNWLDATAPGGALIKIAGFSNSQIQVYDISNPLSITQLTGRVGVDSLGSNITVLVPGVAAANETHTLIAFSSDQIAAPDAIAFHPSSTLEQQRAGGDVVIITHPDFLSTVAPLVSLRQSQQHQVVVVTVDQLFDAYNFGERSPFALQSYLQSASTQWTDKPQYLLLLGDASLDPRNYLGFGDFDFVPTRLIETAAFKTASDDWLSDFQNTGFATIPTGRIPARTAADASLAISKIVNYETGASQGSWMQQALVIADQNNGVDFTGEANMAATLMPSSLTTTKILADGMPTTTVSQQIMDAVNNGVLLVNYTGHGAEQQLSFSDFFDTTSAAALTNGGRTPVFLLMDCLNGFFQDVYESSLATSLLLAPNGGAVAVWASSGFTTAPPQASMDQSLLRSLAANPSQPLGDAIMTAKSQITDPDVRRTWILFGDPAMRIAFPGVSSAPTESPRTAPSVPRPR